ncbi:type 1 glutamine amidotransferase domain-containing protein [Brachybacterium saurashtrense]|uniref:Type 1 glutamine amidotransferase n=1 Tax=Brachybacterium saurashtrense TaxID=556288 RepID=A0A345YRM4_9MICO|nr:type 1 glutamine amidotransferase domain-containing protein [Brachybacterium saurashtrense]AXK46576.1 type 1 glutamine amidotransferase [Brachybacterium saurashtrense]RRR24317.1 type 1 glutamine amidotransferase [Brachybacterium saurashtrense]
MANALEGRTILILTSNFGTETDEIRHPLDALREAGAEVIVAAPEEGTVLTLERDRERGADVPVDTTLDTVDPAGVDALVLPGGTLNADTLRTDETAQRLVRAVAAAGRPVAAICHAPWLLVETGLAEGSVLTSVPGIRTDMVNAGAEWLDREVVVDDHAGYRLLTSRTPDDLDAFTGAIIEALTSPAPGGAS